MKQKLLKTMRGLLVAAGLCVGVNAWAVNYYTQNYESDGVTADWSTSTSGRFTPVILEENGNHYLSVDQGTRNNNGCTISSISLSGKVAAGTDFTMTFDFKIQSSTNQTPVSFTIYDAANSSAMFSLTATGTYSKTWQINGNATQTVELENTGTVQSITSHTWFSSKVSRKGGVTYLTITKKSDASVIFARTSVTTASETGGLGKMDFVTRRYDANFAIDNIVIRDIEEGDVPDETVYKITTKYQLADGTQVKADHVDNVTEGNSYEPVYDTTFDDDDYRYTYVSGANSIASVSEDATITIIYSREALAEHTVNFKTVGAIERTLATVTVKDAKSYTYAYPRYLADGENLYQIDKSRYDQGFQNTASNVTADVDRTETFNKIDGVVAFFSEAEDIAALTTSTTNNNIPSRCSGGNAAYASADADIVTLNPGKYTITAAVFGNAGTDFVFKSGETTLFTITTAGYELESTSEELTFTNTTTVTLAQVGNGGSSPKVIDYILVKRTGDYTVPVSVASGKEFATFNSDYALDFTNVTDIIAYTAKMSADGSTVTLAKVMGAVPANTGLLIRKAGESTSADVPVVATAAAVDNDFIAVTATNCDAGQDYKTVTEGFILATVSGKQGFYKANSTDGTQVAKGKAYLPATGYTARLTMNFDDEANGISDIRMTTIDNAVYNLNGVQVSQPTKGLYIVNGKKVIIK